MNTLTKLSDTCDNILNHTKTILWSSYFVGVLFLRLNGFDWFGAFLLGTLLIVVISCLFALIVGFVGLIADIADWHNIQKN